jgi:DNA invertase Pin-like site-specific DNA recombinase
LNVRCAIYARYSSETQREASIDDQLRICRARAEREGWQVVQVFHDAAFSGATTLRSGYQTLMATMRQGAFDLVLAESLDRFSRDQEHIAGFYKQAAFSGVRVVTLAEGEVNELHIGLKGTMGALYLKDLADKTRRGLEGRIRAGRSAGAVAYGYRVVRQVGPDGEVHRGLREIDPIEAAVIRRIFADYASGQSPLAIARSLNDEGVPGPGGGPWFDSTIRGRAGRGDGLLRNPVYVGVLVWNRKRTVKDPVTGKRRRRQNDPSSHVTQEVPSLRLIDDDLWQQVQVRLAAKAARPAVDGGVAAFWEGRRPRHLLTGKVVCGVCSGLFYARGRDYLGCQGARRHLCRNTTSVRRGPLEAQVLEALGRQLMRPELVAEFVTEFTREWNRLAAEAGQAQAAQRRALEAVERKIDHLAEVISRGVSPRSLLAKLETLEGQREKLTAELADSPGSPPALHSNLAEVYRKRVASLREALADRNAPEALEAARALIDRVIVHPADEPGDPPGIELVGQLQSMLGAGGARLSAGNQALAAAALHVLTSSEQAGQGGQRPPREPPAPPSPRPPHLSSR